jgi:prophage antirepressor-like protein
MNKVAIINQENKNQNLNELSIKKFQDLNVPIYGTYEEPLFKAKDIGNLLDIKNIRDTISKFDDKCITKINVGNNDVGNSSNTWFLTEDGLYELLFISRKPLAKQFKIWLRNVIKEIRLTGKYETQKYIESHTKSDLLIEQNKDKSINYLGIVEETPDYTIAKYGHTKYAKDTLNRHKETYGDNFHFVHILECERNHDLEKKIQTHTDLVSRHIKEYQGTKRMELLRLDNNFTLNNLIELIKSLKDSMETKYSIQLELSKELTKQKEIDTKQKEIEIKQKELEYAFELKKLEMNHILEMRKLELNVQIQQPIQPQNEQPQENLSEELQFHKWLNENVTFTIGNILIWKNVTFKLMNKNVGSNVSSKYKKYFENWCEIKFPNVNNVTYKVHRTGNGGVRGYTNFKLLV